MSNVNETSNIFLKLKEHFNKLELADNLKNYFYSTVYNILVKTQENYQNIEDAIEGAVEGFLEEFDNATDAALDAAKKLADETIGATNKPLSALVEAVFKVASTLDDKMITKVGDALGSLKNKVLTFAFSKVDHLKDKVEEKIELKFGNGKDSDGNDTVIVELSRLDSEGNKLQEQKIDLRHLDNEDLGGLSSDLGVLADDSLLVQDQVA